MYFNYFEPFFVVTAYTSIFVRGINNSCEKDNFKA